VATKAQLETQLKERDMIDAQRQISDERYAIKLVEKIVFGICVTIFTTMIYFIIQWVRGGMSK
jgi:hypothetical protein